MVSEEEVVVVVVVIVVVCGVSVVSEEASSFMCLQVVGSGWFVGV